MSICDNSSNGSSSSSRTAVDENDQQRSSSSSSSSSFFSRFKLTLSNLLPYSSDYQYFSLNTGHNLPGLPFILPNNTTNNSETCIQELRSLYPEKALDLCLKRKSQQNQCFNAFVPAADEIILLCRVYHYTDQPVSPFTGIKNKLFMITFDYISRKLFVKLFTIASTQPIDILSEKVVEITSRLNILIKKNPFLIGKNPSITFTYRRNQGPRTTTSSLNLYELQELNYIVYRLKQWLYPPTPWGIY